jgi:hypothetical protein
VAVTISILVIGAQRFGAPARGYPRRVSMPLPPLPPVPEVDPQRHRPDGSSIVVQLGVDHDLLAGLCERTRAEPDPDRRSTLVDVLIASVTRHLSAEEQYLYPAVRATLPGGEDLGGREVAADVAILTAMAELDATAGDAPQFGARLEAVAGLLAGHVRRVGGDLLPLLAATLGEEDLIRLGNRVAIAREAAPSRPRPATPVTPPWNRVVEPGLGAVDKVRDALARRRTRAEDL